MAWVKADRMGWFSEVAKMGHLFTFCYFLPGEKQTDGYYMKLGGGGEKGVIKYEYSNYIRL